MFARARLEEKRPNGARPATAVATRVGPIVAGEWNLSAPTLFSGAKSDIDARFSGGGGRLRDNPGVALRGEAAIVAPRRAPPE
jgi:hypothetical protein